MRSLNPLRRVFLCAPVLLMMAAAPASDPYAPVTTALRDALTSTQTPGAAAEIRVGDKIVWQAALGQAKAKPAQPFRADTLSSVASVTKTVMATMVLRLVENGTLSLDAPIAPYLPSTIPATNQVTLRQLLGMRSGYNEIENEPGFLRAIADPNHLWSRQQFYRLIKAPHFTPGSQFEYVNTNYLLLSAIVAKVAPGGVPGAFRRLIAQPAGLGQDVVFARDPAVAPRVADGWETSGGRRRNVNAGARNLGVNTSVWGPLWGDGGIVATADGLVRFCRALFGGRLVKPETLAAMRPGADGNDGLGLQTFTIGGHDYFGHFGAFNGYVAVIGYDPARDTTIALVANALDEDTGAQVNLLYKTMAAYDAVAAQ